MDLTKKIVDKSTPQNVFNLINELKLRLNNLKLKIILLIQNLISNLKKINFKEEISKITGFFNSGAKYLKEKGAKNIYLALVAFLLAYGAKLKKWYFGLQPKVVLGMAVSGGVITLATISIVASGNKIAVKTRAPAAIEEPPKGMRPSYYKQEKKYYKIGNFRIPIYIGETNQHMKTLQIEFTVLTSDRFSKKFLEKNEHLSRDYVLTTLEPLIPEFTLDAEGKRVIKDKIKKELNNLLIKNNVEGRVVDLYIHDIITN